METRDEIIRDNYRLLEDVDRRMERLEARLDRQNVEIAGQTVAIWNHPDIGWCLIDNGGAQSSGCCYDQGQQESATIKAILDAAESGQPGYISAQLASDGWHWAIVQPYRFDLD